MNSQLSLTQLQALRRYRGLIRLDSRFDLGLFEGRHKRPIVTDLDEIARYAVEHRVVLGVAAVTPQVLFVVDLVESQTRFGRVSQHPYLRVISRAQLKGGQSVVVLATIQNPDLGTVGDIVLVRQERHAIGEDLLELPRGFGEPHTTGEVQALEELRTETGFVGESPDHLGTTITDSGTSDGLVAYYHVRIRAANAAAPELTEAITEVRLFSREEIWDLIRAGGVKDGYTAQALALYEAHLRG